MKLTPVAERLAVDLRLRFVATGYLTPIPSMPGEHATNGATAAVT